MQRERKTFSSTLNIMILQMVRNGSVRFGGHVDVQVSYKILQSKLQTKALIFAHWSCFQATCFEIVLDSTWLLMFRG